MFNRSVHYLRKRWLRNLNSPAKIKYIFPLDRTNKNMLIGVECILEPARVTILGTNKNQEAIFKPVPQKQ